ncbi:MAG TPA: hypothetical protein VIR57_10320 [Chloroflexota bacterium]
MSMTVGLALPLVLSFLADQLTDILFELTDILFLGRLVLVRVEHAGPYALRGVLA